MGNVRSQFSSMLKLFPGLAVLFGLGYLSKYIGGLIPHVSFLLVCILLGLLISNIFNLPGLLEKGINDTYKIWLKTGIVVLGARVILSDLLAIGPNLLWMVLLFLCFTLLATEYLSSQFGLNRKLRSSLASGTSVCGVSAIIATSGAIRADEEDVTYAIATILLFDAITVFLYPAVGEIFAIPSRVFGSWAGISMFSTGTTVAAGFAYNDVAGQVATITKMARNIFIGIWALLYAVYYVRLGTAEATGTYSKGKMRYIWQKFPKFIIGFILTMLVATLGVLTDTQVSSMKNAYNWFFMLAFVGLGYNINLTELKKAGLKPVVVVTVVFIITSLSSLGLSYLLFG